MATKKKWKMGPLVSPKKDNKIQHITKEYIYNNIYTLHKWLKQNIKYGKKSY